MNPLRAWKTFWFQPTSARPLGAFRIIFGLIVLVNLGLESTELTYWWTNAGILRGAEAREFALPYRFTPLLYAETPWMARGIVAASVVAGVLFTLGWRTRVMSVLLYLGNLALYQRNVACNCGPDALLMVMLFYLMLSPCGAAYSLDARREARRRGTLAEPIITPWAQRLIQCQLAMMYFSTAVWKCAGVCWPNGTALYYIINNAEVGRFSLDPLSQYPIAFGLLTHLAFLTEFLIPFFIWFRPTRPWVIVLGLGLHIGVLFTVNVPLFGEMMTACYLTFLTPEEWDGLMRGLNPINWFRRSPTATVSGRLDPPSALRGPHREVFEASETLIANG